MTLEFLREFIRAVNRHSKSTEIILEFRISNFESRINLPRNVIRKAMVELSRRLLHLLTQEIEGANFFRARFITVNINIVANRVCRPKRMNAARDQKLLRDDVIKKCLRIIEKFSCLFTYFWVVKHRRITAAQFPRMKKRRPIDKGDQVGKCDCAFLR